MEDWWSDRVALGGAGGHMWVDLEMEEEDLLKQFAAAPTEQVGGVCRGPGGLVGGLGMAVIWALEQFRPAGAEACGEELAPSLHSRVCLWPSLA